jgi:hypothetical protein
MLTMTDLQGQNVAGLDGFVENLAVSAIPANVKASICSMLGSKGQAAAAALLALVPGSSVLNLSAALTSMCPKSTTTTTPETPAPKRTYFYADAPKGGYVVFSPGLSGNVSGPVIEVAGSNCIVDNWDGFGDVMFGGDPTVTVSPTAPADGTKVTAAQLVEMMKAAGISLSQIQALLPTPWYKNWKYLVPIGVGVVGAAAGGYYLYSRKKGE